MKQNKGLLLVVKIIMITVVIFACSEIVDTMRLGMQRNYTTYFFMDIFIIRFIMGFLLSCIMLFRFDLKIKIKNVIIMLVFIAVSFGLIYLNITHWVIKTMTGEINFFFMIGAGLCAPLILFYDSY